MTFFPSSAGKKLPWPRQELPPLGKMRRPGRFRPVPGAAISGGNGGKFMKNKDL